MHLRTYRELTEIVIPSRTICPRVLRSPVYKKRELSAVPNKMIIQCIPSCKSCR